MNIDTTKNSKKFNTLIFFIAFINAIFLVIALDVDFETISIKAEILLMLKLFGYLLIGFVLAILVHELGHMIYGLLSGYKFHSYQFLIFKIVKDENKLKFKIEKNGLLGQCIMTYDKAEDEIDCKKYMLGGAKINLYFSLISYTCLVLLYVTTSCDTSLLHLIAWMNLNMFLSNRIPMNIKGIYNDGLNASLIDNCPDSKIILLKSIKLQELMDSNVSANNLNDELLNTDEYTLPENFIHLYPFIVARFVKKLVNKDNEPFNEIMGIHYRRNQYPSMYQNMNVELVMCNYLLNDLEYRGCLYDNANRKVFKHPNKKDPLVMLIMNYVEYKENKIDRNELNNRLNELEKNIDKVEPNKMNKEMVSELYKLFKLKINIGE